MQYAAAYTVCPCCPNYAVERAVLYVPVPLLRYGHYLLVCDLCVPQDLGEARLCFGDCVATQNAVLCCAV
jgi:hypothetical protein